MVSETRKRAGDDCVERACPASPSLTLTLQQRKQSEQLEEKVQTRGRTKEKLSRRMLED